MTESYFSAEITANVIIQSLAFLIGFFINVKVISVCSRNRDTKTWQIHIANAIIVTIFFAFDLPFVTISNALPHLSVYTGEWLCNLASLIVSYGVNFIITNSVLIAAMKYIYIVHWDKAMRFGHEKIQRIFLVVTITLPCFFAVVATLTRNFDSYKAIKSCFGMPDEKKDSRTGAWQRFFLCNLSYTDTPNAEESSVFYILIQIVCVSRSVLETLLCTNLLEAFFYYKIFKKMRR